MHEAIAFGRTWRSDHPLAAFSPLAGAVHAEPVEVRERGALAERGPALHKGGNGELYADGLRLFARDEASFDVFADGRVDWVKGPGWSGEFPPEMYSVVAATALAMTGTLPLHGSAVEVGGQAVLLCGPGSAGKSTLAAGLCAVGARLVSDDLTVVTGGAEQDLFVHAGRRTIRLLPAMAHELVGAMTVVDRPEGPRGKLLVRPAMVDPHRAVPLRAVVLLEPGDALEVHPADVLLGMQFRPKWMTHLPGVRERLVLLDRVARHVPLRRFAPRPLTRRAELEDVARTLLAVALG